MNALSKEALNNLLGTHYQDELEDFTLNLAEDVSHNKEAFITVLKKHSLYNWIVLEENGDETKIEESVENLWNSFQDPEEQSTSALIQVQLDSAEPIETKDEPVQMVVRAQYTSDQLFKVPKGLDLEDTNQVLRFDVQDEELIIRFADGTEKMYPPFFTGRAFLNDVMYETLDENGFDQETSDSETA